MINRLQTADLLKGIAVLLMIQVHILELFATPQISLSNTGKILFFLGGSFVAPVFAVVFGYFIARVKNSTAQLIVRGVKIFFAGMLLNIALNFNLIISVSKGVLDVDLLPYIFGVDIFHFAGISLVILGTIKKLLEKSYFIPIGISVLVAFLGHYLLRFTPDSVYLKYVTSFFYGSTHWSYFPIFPWLAYPLVGMAFFQLKQKLFVDKLDKLFMKLLMGIIFLLFMAFTIHYAINISANLEHYYHHGVIFFLWTIIFLVFYSFFLNEVQKKLGQSILIKYIRWLGENVTAFYVIQWIIIGNIATSIYRSISSISVLIGSYIGILVLSSLITWIYVNINTKQKENT